VYKRQIYGGNDDEDNSGIFRYVSIRHGGTQVTINNEINALTMGGVGNQTTIEYVEAYANEDDGFEWFGGTVNTRYLVSAYNEDDLFDYDQGWRGSNQFWLGLLTEESKYAGEQDGGTEPETGTPYSSPLIANVSYVGSGTNSANKLMIFRDNAGCAYYNSIFSGFSTGVEIEFLGDNEQDSYKNFTNDLIVFQNNILFNIQQTPVFSITNQSALPNDNFFVVEARNNTATYFNDVANGNNLDDPGIAANGVPLVGSLASTGAKTIDDPFISSVTYRGCFNPSAARWIADWTRVSEDF